MKRNWLNGIRFFTNLGILLFVGIMAMAGCKDTEKPAEDITGPIAAIDLIAAVQENDNTKAEQLILGVTDINGTDETGATALHWAANRGNIEIARLLVENGADIESLDGQYGSSPLNWAAFDGKIEIVIYLLDEGADINTVNKFGNTPLINAVMNNSIEMAAALTEKNADKEIVNNDGKTALDIALEKGFSDIAELLK